VAGIVEVHFGVDDHAVLSNDVARRHRKRPSRIVVKCRQIVVELDQLVGQIKAQSVRGADPALHVRQDRERELVLAYRFADV